MDPVEANLLHLGSPPGFITENYKWRNYEISEIEHYSRELLRESETWKMDAMTDYRTAYQVVNVPSMNDLLEEIDVMLSSSWKVQSCTGKCGVSFDKSTSVLVLRTEMTGFRICSSGVVAALAIDAIKNNTNFSWSVGNEDELGGAHRELHLYIPEKVARAIASLYGGGESILAKVCVAEYVRHLNDYSHWGIEGYAGDRFAMTINKDLEHFNKFAHTIYSSRSSSISILMRNRASRRLWGTYEHGWCWCADDAMTEKFCNWLEDDKAELFLDFSPDVLAEVHLAYIALARYSDNKQQRALGLEIVLKSVSGRFGMPLPISMFIRDQGETKSHKWIPRDAPIFGSFAATKAVGAIVDINWENLTMSNLRNEEGRGLLSQQFQQSKYRRVLRLGQPIKWYNSVSSWQALAGGVGLILARIFALRLDTGVFHFLWALVFSNHLMEEAALWTLPGRFIGVWRNDVAVGADETISHTLMITTVGLVEAMYELDIQGKEWYTKVVSLFWSVVLLATLLSHISPFFIHVRKIHKEKPDEIVQLANKDFQFWNDLVLDAGADMGLRCGGQHLVSGVSLVNEEQTSDVGDKWQQSLGHTEMQAGTTRFGSTVCVG